MNRVSILTCVVIACSGLAPARAEDRKNLFEKVVRVLEERYFDKDFRENQIPGIAERYRALADSADGLRAQREITHAFLTNIPATHLGLLSRASFEQIFNELQGRSVPTFGFELIEHDGKHFAHSVLDGGPAEAAGLLRGDRIVSIDGVLAGQSPRLDWRTDDAYLDDPPVRGCRVDGDEDVIFIDVERQPGKYLDLAVRARPYSALEAARASAKIIRHRGLRVAYVHFWFIHHLGTLDLLREKLTGDFSDCDAFIFDLRGRGGSGNVLPAIIKMFDGPEAIWSKPMVALINRLSRSAKEVISYEIRQRGIGRLVGETTAGAVIPASFQEVGRDTLLMFPSFTMGKYTDRIEGVGVRPHLFVEEARPYSAGYDPLIVAGLREAGRMCEDGGRRRAADDSTSDRKLAWRRTKPQKGL